MSTAHAKLSASSAHRWLHCPGSVAASEKIPARSSFAADEGSAAHELAEIALNAGKTDCSYLSGKPCPITMLSQLRGKWQAMSMSTCTPSK